MTDRQGRLAELDLFKSLLVVGMVATHVLQLLGRSMPGWTDRFGEFINLVTFSGFLLALGIGLGLARQGARPWWLRLRPVMMLLAATYISSFAFAMLVDREKLTQDLAVDILTMRRLFGWSEFLATFFTLYALVAVARPLLAWIGSRLALLILVSVLCLASCWLVLNLELPLLATLVGTTKFASFPLLPYLPWLLVGIALGRADGRLTIWHASAALVGTGWLLWGLLDTGELPGRFPPTLSWIIGPALPLLLYLLMAKLITIWTTVPGWINVPGRHVLSFLVVSNLAIFTLRHLLGRPIVNVWAWLALTTLILAAVGGAWIVWERHVSRASRGPDSTTRLVADQL
jgi:hypothetical protein